MVSRRDFLAGLGAALGAIAVVTKLGQSDLRLPAAKFNPNDYNAFLDNAYLTDSSAWYLVTAEPAGVKYHRVSPEARFKAYGSSGT